MSASDAFVVGEGWISEHFFTSDATSQSFRALVLARRKEWDAEPGETPRSRFTAARGELQTALADLSQRVETLREQARDDDTVLDTTALADLADGVADRLTHVLELDRHGLRSEGDGPLRRVRAAGLTGGAPLALVRALPVTALEDLLAKDGVTLAAEVAVDEESEPTRSAARLLSQLFVQEDGPTYALVLAGRWAMLAERARWAEGRYLAVDLQLVAERNDTRRGGEVDTALTCLSAASVAPDTEGRLWWDGVLEASVKHTVGVSQDLRDGVRLSIEIIANDVVTRRAWAGLEPLPQAEAQVLAKQSLRFLYRILFLLYAEASPELGVLPTGAPEYDAGYSLDRLRETVQVPLTSDRALHGTHLYESLGVLFRLVDTGHVPPAPREDDLRDEGLTFHALRADLFSPAATAHIDEVGLGNGELQRVLGHLLLSKEKRGADRGYISYAELGINQLGAVYEGLMSYTGFFAQEDLFEVAKDGDASKGSWVVPADRIEGIASKDFVRAPDPVTGELQPVLHRAGTFVFRLAGRERQQSASFYTPEVLTRFTVGQALEELLDQGGTTTSAADVLRMTVCEPALGSGAFALEAVRQLAEQYLTRRQDELGERIDPDAYPRELQRAKAYIALHNVYGVDLNATAVELAEISLWLDTMVAGLDAPWFGLHLRRGNSLIGARRALYRRDQVTDKSWLRAVPTDAPLTTLLDGPATGIHHFLLPADGWGAAAYAKEAAALAPDATKALKAWRSALKAKPTKGQIDALTEIAHRVEVLWQIAARRMSLAEQGIRRSVDVWGAEVEQGATVTREQVEASLADADGAYRRLRRVMDAWCALWFWPLTEATTTVERGGTPVQATPPRLDEWIDALQRLVGRAPELKRRSLPGNQTLTDAASWDELQDVEEQVLLFADAKPVADVVRDHPWLEVCERVAAEQGFFHWELDFSSVFLRGGFDLQVGNPPWVRPDWDEASALAEGDPWWQLAVKPSQSEVLRRREATLELPGMRDLVLTLAGQTLATRTAVSARTMYPHLTGLRPDLYRCFMELMWRHTGPGGMAAMIHLESHFTDEKAGALRRALYQHLRRHWHFVNELLLFEIEDHKHFGITVHGRARDRVEFVQASWLYHPDTAVRSLHHDGSGPEPGLKDEDGRWDVRPHRSRITHVTEETLRTWHAVLETADVSVPETRMVYAVNTSAAATLDKLARSPRIGALGLRFSAGWNEKTDRVKGYFESAWGPPESWDDVILQGPHLFVSTPFYKTPNKTMLHNQDWSATDFEALAPDAIPVTAYKPAGDRYDYDCAYDDWGTPDDPQPARDHYRIAWRNMAANQGERTLIPAIIPPGPAHVDGVYSMGSPTLQPFDLAVLVGGMSSLLSDFAIRTVPKSNIRSGTASRLPAALGHRLSNAIALRALRLNAVTEAWGALVANAWRPEMLQDAWTGGRARPNRPPLGLSKQWSSLTPLRRPEDRRQAQLEIDAAFAVALGISADELCAVYRTQFAVLYGYDRTSYVYDANGRLVPTSVLQAWRRKGDAITEADRTAAHPGSGIAYTYELPFVTLDREADMRRAYAEFERRLAERS
ncbi:class I SAM-dependent DNA methyltransferase [Cellulomonas sp. 179-A 9B4 NHS]|uniref:class I SAM-dependent DNA methyltransferase n=1 Tax=Cellulomonas sp. 179-A 9B4 NHS TaxID=3142379 RepID=UPI00399EFB4E